MRNASSLVPKTAFIAEVTFPPATAMFIPLFVLFGLLELTNCCALVFELFSRRLFETGKDMVEVNEVTVVVRIVARDEENVVTIKPCRMKSL